MTMPWTLYRYILADLLKLLVVSTAVLVTVVSTAMAIKPLADGLLDPLTLLKFIFYTTPTILDVTLPFAAAFATTLVFCRMVADNEILACRAGGLRHGVVLLPVIVLGLALTLSLFYLSNWVVPGFYNKAEFTLQRDALRMIAGELKDGKPFRQGNFVIYADAVGERDLSESSTTPGDGTAVKRITMLRGIAVGTIDDAGGLRSDATAERADLVLQQDGERSWVTLSLRNAMYNSNAENEPWGSVSELEHVVPLPKRFSGRLRFMSWSDLQELNDRPEKLASIDGARQRLIGAMTEQQILKMATEQTDAASPRPMVVLGLTDRERYVIHAKGGRRDGDSVTFDAVGDGHVEVEYFVAGAPRARYRAKHARFQVNFRENAIHIRLRLDNVDVEDLRRRGRFTQHTELNIRPLRWPEDHYGAFARLSTFDLMAVANDRFADNPAVTVWSDYLYKALVKMARQRQAYMFQRAAMALMCTLVMALAAVFAIRLQGRMPLVVFFWTFLIVAFAVLLGRSGDNVLGDPNMPRVFGVLVIWSGNLLLLATTGVLVWQVKRA